MKKQCLALVLALVLTALCAVPALALGAMETINYSNGDLYYGEVVNGKPNGVGTYTLPSGIYYHGDFVDGYFQGKGVYVWPDGTTYAGDFEKDLFQGKGVLTLPEGEYYIGEFYNDQYHGNGTYYAADGSVLRSGRFENGKFVEGTEAAAPATAPAPVTEDAGLKTEDVVGTWVCETFELSGMTLNAADFDLDSSMTFYADGTCLMMLNGEDYHDKWTIKDDKISMGSDLLPIVDGKIRMELDGGAFIYTRQ